MEKRREKKTRWCARLSVGERQMDKKIEDYMDICEPDFVLPKKIIPLFGSPT